MNANNFFQRKYQKTVNSIAFYPAIIALGFLVLCGLMISFDYSQQGKLIKGQLHWLRLKDATTARSIISAVAAGVISLTVFSFSMVVIVLNQAASQMSNRVLGQLIGNKFQQIVLGIYIGTIIYAFFLLSTIRDIDSGVYIPALSTYLLIFFTIFDIFIFIYFLHYITQSVKYEVVIQRIFDDTMDSLKKACPSQHQSSLPTQLVTPYNIKAAKSGIFEGIEIDPLKSLCTQQSFQITILISPGTFVLQGTPIIGTSKDLPKELQSKLLDLVIIPLTETIKGNYFYGFSQLREIALKALSPGINDPVTAIISLRALSSLILYRASHFPESALTDDQGTVLTVNSEISFETVACESINPIWDYGKNDRLVCRELYLICQQLRALTATTIFDMLISEIAVREVAFIPPQT
ncbi:DUF2254 domain-containing protein [Dyadobacter psychrotolerans]|uniref:DUF2254 domain-containing protein n=1 Tax=Dyadobacter psychrotolerans TaxID=2541721 RepID=A0A4R5DUI8_9BACT|nr:DUF2254 family protein [Dyadobacter psychrotolerans]TDE18129.1 DUF2254 domain-containing protein [Dyadobacter psychrotolerans]